MSKFGERLKELRLENSLTQAKLAQATGINQTSISSYERIKMRPTDEVIIILCKYFKVSADYMLGLVD